MAIPFNADEVYEMAEEIERNGARFYRKAAEKFPAISELFQKLALMEDEHLATFASLRADLSAAETEQPMSASSWRREAPQGWNIPSSAASLK